MRVVEIFYSIQGEGKFTGTPSVFIRLAGCNLKCDFCDTNHSTYIHLNEDEIVEEVQKYTARHIVITGGEPLLQLNAELLNKLHNIGKYVQVETNGTVAIDKDLASKIDWITCSPKNDYTKNADIKVPRVDEIKVVYVGQDLSKHNNLRAEVYYLQPCDVGVDDENKKIVAKTVEYIKDNPKWKLSVQVHKILNLR